jgi:threonine/homoserine/homoserine lactone efflux protein
MTPEQAWAFGLFALVAAITPGPSNVMLSAAGALGGIRGGLPCLLGVSAGMGTMIFAVAIGLGALLLAQPALLGAMRWGGAALLLWMAWKIGRASGNAGTPSRPVGFIAAAALQWLNPKSWLVAAAAAATYFDPAATSPAVLALIFVAVALPCGFAWLAFGALMRRLRGFNVVMALALAASVVLVLI